MFYKKGQINQVFVYLLSIIIIVFAGFLVTKFIFSFGENVETYTNQVVFDSFKESFSEVYYNYGSEKSQDFTVTSEVKKICLIANIEEITSLSLESSLQTDLKLIGNSGPFIVLLDDSNQIINSETINQKFTGTFCKVPQSNKFSLQFENYRGEIFIS